MSVNEAVELAKKYSSEDAGSFINGILSRLSDIKSGAGDEKSDTESEDNY